MTWRKPEFKAWPMKLCNVCGVGIPTWMTDGYGRDRVMCKNCGHHIDLPYSCGTKEWVDRWNTNNPRGAYIKMYPRTYCPEVKTIYDLAPVWNEETEMHDRIISLEEKVLDLTEAVEEYEGTLKEIKNSYWLVPKDEPLTDIMLAQYDEAMRTEKELLEFRDGLVALLNARDDLPAGLYTDVMKLLLHVDESPSWVKDEDKEEGA